jgi:hypothetical protein
MRVKLGNKILFNKLTTKQVDSFESNNFFIEFGSNWRQIRRIGNKTVLNFINLKNFIGVLQISSYQHSDRNFVTDLDLSLCKVEQRGYKAEIRNVSMYQSVVYALNHKDKNTYQFCFEFAHINKELFVTLTFDNTNKDSIAENYNEVVKILNTLKFKD